jgi:hypothetical protein
MSLKTAFTAGATGAFVTNALHEITRRRIPDAPRVDLLGMQGIARLSKSFSGTTPTGRALYMTTLAVDLLSNGAMFALVAAAPPERALVTGAAIGTLAGVGAATLPRRLGFDSKPTERTAQTRALTIALYAAGGIAAGLVRTFQAQRG